MKKKRERESSMEVCVPLRGTVKGVIICERTMRSTLQSDSLHFFFRGLFCGDAQKIVRVVPTWGQRVYPPLVCRVLSGGGGSAKWW